MFAANAFHGFFNVVRRRPFLTGYQCYSISMFPGHDRPEVENGGKIFLPPSALQYLTQLNVAYPMLFKLTNIADNRSTHCGVLEFVADEGKMYIPYWMMRNLMIDEGDMIQVESATLPIATYSKFEPQSAEFLEISNPKAMLENALRNFACLTAGDVIAIRYNDRIYEMRVLETRPGDAVNIIECDMDVEFAKPIGYVEPKFIKGKKVKDEGPAVEELSDALPYLPFLGNGIRLDGKSVIAYQPASQVAAQGRGSPDLDFRIGHLNFCRNFSYYEGGSGRSINKKFNPFDGFGAVLKPRPTNP